MYIALRVTLFSLHTNLQTARNCPLISYCRFFSEPLSFMHLNFLPAHCIVNFLLVHRSTHFFRSISQSFIQPLISLAQFLNHAFAHSSLSPNFSTIHSPTHLSLNFSTIHSPTHFYRPISQPFTPTRFSLNFSTIHTHSFLAQFLNHSFTYSSLSLNFSFLHPFISRPISRPSLHPLTSFAQFLIHSPTHLSPNFSTIPSLTHLFRSISHSFTHSFLAQFLDHSFTRSPLSFNFSFIHPLISRPISQPFIHPLISRPISQPFLHSLISLAQFSPCLSSAQSLISSYIQLPISLNHSLLILVSCPLILPHTRSHTSVSLG
jgi:hypothetical protein